MNIAETIAAISTPPGAGGIAVLRISGAEAFSIMSRCFRLPNARTVAVKEVRDRHAYFGNWCHPSTQKVLDEVVVTVFVGPRSYTGEDVVEISCHGSLYIQQEVLASCVAAGARLAGPGEFTQRAFLNGRMDLTQAEGVGDLIASETAASHQLALQQMKGGISRAMAGLRKDLIDFAALVELENDFGEEDVTFADRTKLQTTISAIQTEINRLISSFATGQALKSGVTTVIAGRPNAGKSSLLNALLDDDRAIVSDIAGTTRDTIEAALIIQGVKFRLIDTAGIRQAVDAVEALGVERTLKEVSRASLLIYVWDVVMTTPEEVALDLEALQREGMMIIGVANKMDQNPYAVFEHYQNSLLTRERFVPVSARNQMNLALLEEKLFTYGVGEVPAPGNVVLTQMRHVTALQEASEALQRVNEAIASELSGDLVALDLRQALHYIGEVTGEISVDDLLGSIFSSFCIGK